MIIPKWFKFVHFYKKTKKGTSSKIITQILIQNDTTNIPIINFNNGNIQNILQTSYTNILTWINYIPCNNNSNNLISYIYQWEQIINITNDIINDIQFTNISN